MVLALDAENKKLRVAMQTLKEMIFGKRLAAQSPVRKHHLQTGKAPDRHNAVRSRACDRPSLARCSSHDRNRRP
jgi:hypothetical protein